MVGGDGEEWLKRGLLGENHLGYIVRCEALLLYLQQSGDTGSPLLRREILEKNGSLSKQ